MQYLIYGLGDGMDNWAEIITTTKHESDETVSQLFCQEYGNGDLNDTLSRYSEALEFGYTVVQINPQQKPQILNGKLWETIEAVRADEEESSTW